MKNKLRSALLLLIVGGLTLPASLYGQVPDDVPLKISAVGQNQFKNGSNATFKVESTQVSGVFTSGHRTDGPDVNVSNLTGNEAEVSIAVNPTNRDNLVIAGHAPGFGTMNTFYSTDGGQSWTRVSLGDAQDGRTSTFRFDPTVTIAGDGNVYVGYGLDDDGDGNRYLLVARSTNGGVSYDQFTTIAVDNSLDKWIIGSGPDNSAPGQFNVYLAYRITESGNVNVRLASSYDQGTTFSVDQRVNDGGSLNTFGMPAVGPNGEVYVVWDDQSNNPTDSSIRVDVSTDNGSTFGGDVLVSTTDVTRGNTNRYDIPAQPSRGILAVPSIAVDRSGGPNNGRIYVAYTTVGGGGFNDTDIALRFSDDQGGTWSSETIVNDDGGSTSQFLPWLDVDQQTGQVVVVWYDARNDPTNNQKVEVFLGVSGDGGSAFDNILVSDGQSDESGNWGNDFLEYIGVASLGGVAFPVWADNSLDPTDLDFFTDQIPIGNPPVADAGPDQTVECESHSGTEVTLDASGSSDPDGDPLTYTWREGATVIAGPTTDATVQVTLAEGVHNITLEVDDGNLLTDTDEVVITVEDTQKPVITLNGPSEITLECGVDTYVELGATVTDVCDPSPVLTIDASSVDVSMPGDYPVVYTAVDASDNEADPVVRTVHVVDTTPPDIIVHSDPTTLWPPDHKYQSLALAELDIEVSDFCDKTLTPEDVVIAAVWSDEPEDAKGGGDGHTLDDIVIASGSRAVDLRAERQGGGNGRVYTLKLELTDASGNTGSTTYEVHVPHDIEAGPLAIDDGCVYTPGSTCAAVMASVLVAEEGGIVTPRTSDMLVGDTVQDVPAAYHLHQNHPNPFNPATVIAFELPEAVHVELVIYDVMGRRVAHLVDAPFAEGSHRVAWEARGLPSGLYLYLLKAGTFTATRQMLLLK